MYRKLVSPLRVLIFIGLAHCMFGQSSGDSAIIMGQVQDAEGQAVVGAKVIIFPAGGFSGPLPSATTDDNGRYRLVSLPLGECWLSATKENAGYPDMNDAMYAEDADQRQKMNLTPGSRQEVNLHLGMPYGTLDISIIDASNNEVIRTSRIKLERDNPTAVTSEGRYDGHYFFVLPHAPVKITVTAPGYLPWRYQDPESRVETLTLAQPEHRKMVVKLTREQK